MKMVVYIKYFLLNLFIVFSLGFIQQYIIFPPFYVHAHYYIIPVLIAALAAFFPARIESRLVSVKAELERLKKKNSKNEIKKIEQSSKMAEKAKYDSLTGAMTKGSFNEIVGFKIMEAKHFDTPLSLIVFDIDHFKKINDSYGHLVGDQVLTEISSLVKSNLRKSEIFVRWGGEEFIVLLPDTTLYNAVMVAEKLKINIGQHRFKNVGRVTCSFGVAQLRREDTIESFIGRADKALYLAKQSGRDRVEVEK